MKDFEVLLDKYADANYDYGESNERDNGQGAESITSARAEITQYLQGLANLCARHRTLALPAPTVDTCTTCAAEDGQAPKHRTEHEEVMNRALIKISGAIKAVRSEVNHFTLNELDVYTDELIQVSMKLRTALRKRSEGPTT